MTAPVWPRLERPAQVGNVTFRAGVSAELVVEAAHRLYIASAGERCRNREERQAAEAHRREIWDRIHGAPPSNDVRAIDD